MHELKTDKQLLLKLLTSIAQCLIGAVIIIMSNLSYRLIGVESVLYAAITILLFIATVIAIDLIKRDLRTVTGKIVKYRNSVLLLEDIDGNTYKLRVFRSHIQEIKENHTFSIEYYKRTKAVNRFKEIFEEK